MKNIIKLLFPLFILASCTTQNEELISSGPSVQSIENLYALYLYDAQEQLYATASALNPQVQTRSANNGSAGDYLLETIVSLPQSAVDSLYNIYCNVENEKNYEIQREQVLQTLADQTSLNQALMVYRFADDYIDSTPNNLALIGEATANQPEIIKRTIIRTAANIDAARVIVSNKQPHGDAYCLDQLKLEIIKNAAENGITDAVVDFLIMSLSVPGIDAPSAVILGCWDLYDGIKMAYDYNQCMLNHLS